MAMAGLMATHGFLEDALMFSDIALEQLDVESKGARFGAKVTESDIREFRATIREKMDAAN